MRSPASNSGPAAGTPGSTSLGFLGAPPLSSGGECFTRSGVSACPDASDDSRVDAVERKEILGRYLDHARRFDEAAARRHRTNGDLAGEVVPLTAPLRRLEQDPTARETQVLQLISDGLVNREIGTHLHLSEETVKSHVRHLLAKLQARSRAHAVAVGFRRGLIE